MVLLVREEGEWVDGWGEGGREEEKRVGGEKKEGREGSSCSDSSVVCDVKSV